MCEQMLVQPLTLHCNAVVCNYKVLEQSSVKDLFNYSAMIVGESSPLLSSLVEEFERCSKKIAELVSGMHFDIWINYTL